MNWKKRSLKNSRLYLVLDTEVHDYARLLKIAQEAVCFGVDIIQLRDKKGLAKDVLRFSQILSKSIKDIIPLIINDRVDWAIASGAHGVHLGQDDIPLRIARRMMGKDAIIGVSCQTLEQAKTAQQKGADYIGFGSVFKTKTKPDRDPMDLNLLIKVVTRIKIPVFAIGGINLENVRALRERGVNRVAVCRAICETANVPKTTQQLKQILNDADNEGKIMRG